VDRRRFLLTSLASILAAPLVAAAQRPTRSPRVGIVADPPHEPNRRLEAFRARLRELGYVEGDNVILEIRRWDGISGHTPAIVADLVGIPVDLLVVSTTGAALAAKRATRTIPIVAAGAGALVESGAVASLARPGGNVTGLTSLQTDLSAKRLDLLKEAVRTLTRIAILISPFREAPAAGQGYLQETEVAARALGVTTHVIRVDGPVDIDAAFKEARQSGAEACILVPNQFWGVNARRTGAAALRHRLPMMSQDPGLVEEGGLIQYGVNIAELWRRAADYVGKILKGANPADLPVEQPTTFELVINLKTARALGLAIPPSVLARADQVID
jgi:ABC-type uncharacterized transport system substrate-binding protein